MNKPSRAKRRPSLETQAEAERIAKATQKPGQTKEQTRLIAQGVQKGIDEYKKQQKVRARAADKAKKQRIKNAVLEENESQFMQAERELTPVSHSYGAWLPWALLMVSWLGFALFYWQFMRAQ
ncbi:DUF2956 domain-containing protein [Oceanisphaera avium]|uniref:DUF2956 domain-containing protein n=1 Tax=Oceanisphaera avium TaxID=1903694 RepID=A0A1Y0CX37_9GAMM|nr:DUF2956 domain-containing protein [Oceanisphaera avium]ART79882.1 hypothetical protein CBP12_06710 [Oceanisphaera avium]